MSTIGDFLASRTHERFGLVGGHLGRLGAGVGRASPVDSVSQQFHQRAEVNAGRVRRVMIVAMARKLLIALWRYATLGVLPEGAVLKTV